MTWKLFLDDERLQSGDVHDAILAIDCAAAIRLIEDFGLPEVMSLDHDLGNNTDGTVKANAMEFMKYLIDGDLDGKFELNEVKRVIVHSRNGTGAANLQGLWDGYSKSELTSGVLAEIRPRKTLIN